MKLQRWIMNIWNDVRLEGRALAYGGKAQKSGQKYTLSKILYFIEMLKSKQKVTLFRNDTIDFQEDEYKKGPKVLPHVYY